MLGARLRVLRLDRGLNQDELSASARISAKHLQLLESGRASGNRPGGSNPRLSTLFLLAEALDVSIERLIGDLP